MRLLRLLFGTILFLMLLFACKSSEIAQGGQNEVQVCEAPNFAFQGGETLVYKLYYNLNFVWVAAGEVTFTTEDTGNQYHVKAVGKTYTSYEKIFKVDDTYEAYLDKTTLLPLSSVRSVKEGNFSLYDKVLYNQNAHTAISQRGNNEIATNKTTHTIPNCMHDLMSVIYFARNVNFKTLEKNSYFPIAIFLDEQTYPLQIQYKGEANKLDVKGLGKYNSQLFAAQTIDGRVFEDGMEIDIWVSADQNQVPLIIASPLSVGSVKAVLKSYKGLRYEMEKSKK